MTIIPTLFETSNTLNKPQICLLSDTVPCRSKTLHTTLSLLPLFFLSFCEAVNSRSLSHNTLRNQSQFQYVWLLNRNKTLQREISCSTIWTQIQHLDTKRTRKTTVIAQLLQSNFRIMFREKWRNSSDCVGDRSGETKAGRGKDGGRLTLTNQPADDSLGLTKGGRYLETGQLL